MFSIPTGSTYLGTSADVWSAGVVLFCLLAIALPFGGSEEGASERAALEEKIRAGEWDSTPTCPPEALDVARRMLCVDPESRATLDEVRVHPWLDAYDVPCQGLDE